MLVDARFQHWQRRIFFIAWSSYASSYPCRVNIAVALPAIRADLDWGRWNAVSTYQLAPTLIALAGAVMLDQLAEAML